MSSANRERRRQNREARMVAVEDSIRRSRRQRIALTVVGLTLAVAVGVFLVAQAAGNNNDKAASPTTTPSDTSSTSSTTTTVPGSVAKKPCVATSGALPTGAPAVPVKVGPPPKQLVKQDLITGTGAVVKPDASVTVNYIGVACSTGKVFDSSYSRNTPFPTKLGAVVPGWQQGIPGMHVGGQRLLGIPPALAYGSVSPGAGIAPDETLWFVVQVLSTK